MPENRYGLDVDYFKKKLKLIVRDLDNYTPTEFHTEMKRLTSAAYPGVETGRKEIEARRADVLKADFST